MMHSKIDDNLQNWLKSKNYQFEVYSEVSTQKYHSAIRFLSCRMCKHTTPISLIQARVHTHMYTNVFVVYI